MKTTNQLEGIIVFEKRMDFWNLVFYLLLTLIAFQALLSLVSERSKRPNLPPGPVPLPVVGDLLRLGSKPHRSLAELAKAHGPIMRLKLGRMTTIVISSSAMAKQLLQKQDLAFSGRSIPNAVHAHSHHKYSVVWLPVAERWRCLRRIMNSHIFSGNRLDANQHLRRKKVEELVSYAGKYCQEGVAMEIGVAVFTTSLNLLFNAIFSVDFTDPHLDSGKEFRDRVWKIMVEAGTPNLVDYFPLLAKIDPQGIRGRMTGHFGKILHLFGQLIDKRLQSRRLSNTATVTENDVIDVLLNYSGGENSEEDIDRTHIEHMCLDVFAAGTDTTSSTVEWAMAELLRNPETLNKAKAELKRTIGRGKPVEESDVARLPYLRAIVKETFRMHPPVPFLIPRKVDTDVEVMNGCGFTVPKGAQVLVNTWAIGRDPNTWPNPTSFVPERFLDSEIDVRGHDFELIPFGAGRRICPGLPLAMRVVHTMLGSLVNCFDWKLEGGIEAKELDMEERFGITLQKAQPLRAITIRV